MKEDMVQATSGGMEDLSVTLSAGLTRKQHSVCALVIEGRTNKEIAQALGISSRTIEGHRDAIYQKMGVRNAVELTRKVLGAS